MSLPQPVATAESISNPMADAATLAPPTRKSSVVLAVRILLIRARFALLLSIVLATVGFWPTLQNHIDRLTRTPPLPGDSGGISSDTEYWCPMCPGVVSDWPSKCPICNMTLVRRTKGEAVPLPDGVMARMQFSPYRIQLAGIRTAVVEYHPLCLEVVLVGVARRTAGGDAVEVAAEAFASDRSLLVIGQAVEASADGLPGHVPFRGKVVRLDPVEATVRLQLEDPDRDLRAGMLVTVRSQVTITQVEWWRRSMQVEWQCQAVAESFANTLARPMEAASARARALLETALQQTAFTSGMGLAVPCSAIIDHGARKVAFVESGPGMFDAVEVTVGPRCRDFYPVLRGLLPGQRVAASGAILLDSEMCLNHNLAATWFGATRSGTDPPINPPTVPSGSPPDRDRLLAAKQNICPVTGQPLDSMGGAVRVEVAGRIVFVCCKGCAPALRKEPSKYLDKLK